MGREDGRWGDGGMGGWGEKGCGMRGVRSVRDSLVEAFFPLGAEVLFLHQNIKLVIL